MKLLVDEDTKAKLLMARLDDAGHDAVSTQDIGSDSAPDQEVFAIARKLGRIVLTKNADDYLALREANNAPGHPGVLAIYQDADPGKNMSYKDIVQAIDNIQVAGISLSDELIALNAWNYPASKSRKTID